MDLSLLKSAKKKSEVVKEKNLEKLDAILEEATNLFNKAHETEDFELLRASADKFSECIHYKSNRVEPYFYLAQIFYTLGDDALTLEYIKIAMSIDPNYPKLKAFRQVVYEDKAEESLQDLENNKI